MTEHARRHGAQGAGGGDSFISQGGTQSVAQGERAIGTQNNYYNSPPAPPPVIPRDLPARETCFLHREQELAWLNERLLPGTVAAVCGPGGMGKSALAAQAVHQLEPSRFPDGILFHSFYHQPKTETALQAICAAFQAEARAGLESAVRQLLSGKQALLILDGAEEADDLPAVLRLRGTCGVLITSRKKTDAQADRLDLKPLDEQPAADVFRLYCRGTACCAPTAADDPSVQAICTILGGWPVGLRIAGRYLSTTGESAADYLRWLEQEPFKELASGQHQEENAALLLRRSVAQVSEDARLALGLAGCLAFASIARGPVEAILDDDERRARTALNELVTYGLLEKQGERWQVSHALVHIYARTELSLSKDVLERLAGWYIAFCKAASSEGVQGYARLDGERVHCLRLMESCLASELWEEVQGLAGAMWVYLDRQGWWTERLAALEIVLVTARQAGDHRDEGVCLNNLGYTCKRRGEIDKALMWYEQSLPIHRELGDRQAEGVTLNNIAMIYQQQGKHELALQTYQQSLSIWREIGDQKGEGATLNNIGGLYKTKGDCEQALHYYEQCLPLRREAGDEIGVGQSLNNIAALCRAQGKLSKALEQHQQALIIRRGLGDRAGEAVTSWNIGLTYEDMGDLAKAEEYIAQAVQIAEQIGHPSLKKWCRCLACVQTRRQVASGPGGKV